MPVVGGDVGHRPAAAARITASFSLKRPLQREIIPNYGAKIARAETLFYF
jgi:hypothetical protein